jgi:hypothetical protein
MSYANDSVYQRLGSVAPYYVALHLDDWKDIRNTFKMYPMPMYGMTFYIRALDSSEAFGYDRRDCLKCRYA